MELMGRHFGEPKTLRQVIEEEGSVLAPCVYDCLSAKIIENTGFKAMCLSGASLAMAFCGVPDIGLVSLGDLEQVVKRITQMANIPMIVDIDTGYGNELNVMYTCERIARAGALAVHLEDQTFPKRCGHLGGKQVIPREDYFSKIRAAHKILKDTDCMLIARTDSYHTHGVDEAIARNLGSLDAGADITFTEGTGTKADIARIAKEVPGLKMFDMVCNGASPLITFDELKDLGYQLVTAPTVSFGGAFKGITEFAERTMKDRSDFYATRSGIPPIEMFGLFGIKEWLGAAQECNKNIQDAYNLKCAEDKTRTDN